MATSGAWGFIRNGIEKITYNHSDPLPPCLYGGKLDMSLMLINDETYGHDVKSINKHRDKTFEDKKGNLYVLSKTLDGCPPFYEVSGPFPKDFQGIAPRLLIDGQHYFGDGKSWQWAEKKFRETIAKRQKTLMNGLSIGN